MATQSQKPEKQISYETMTDLDIAKRLVSTSNSAYKRGIEFDLSFAKLKKVMQTKKCYITGVQLTHVNGDDNKLTLDRLDNEKGYSDDNIIACAHVVNQQKGSLSVKQIEQMYKALVKHGDIKKKN